MAVESPTANLSLEQRKELVAVILETIPIDEIELTSFPIAEVNGAAGNVCINGLPLVFRAGYDPRKLDLLDGQETNWGFTHAPYKPSGFSAPFLTVGRRESDLVYVLRKLGVRKGTLEVARTNGTISELFGKKVEQKNAVYQKFDQTYHSDVLLRKAYSTAISLACDIRQAQLHSPS